MRTRIALLSGICLLILSTDVLAWNKPGHMVSAAIAYADLQERNPTVLAKVVRLLTRHPEFERMWGSRLAQIPADQRELYLLMLAARWADDVRGDEQYDMPGWHFVNIPYRPGRDRVAFPQGDNILVVLPKNRAIVESAHKRVEDRAVALCWMLHLIGDIHQPLHTTTLVTGQFPPPEGDRGGTRFYIQVKPGGSTISLHKFWDGLVLGSDRFQTVRNKATELRNNPALTRESLVTELAKRASDDWAKTAHGLAVEHAYRKGTLHGSSDKYTGPVLPRDYTDRAEQVAEKQITLSGYRISDAMVEIFGK